ncbi:MAG: septum formation inhibitor Maf [Gammaproteobacteria bacterium]|nr:septum formation inhibitor Maf [Gammaproteobacteria bacterium]
MCCHSVLLASSSPRRVSLLQQVGLMFETMSPDVDESLVAGEMPVNYVERLSKSKAAAGLIHRPTYVVIAADTVVALGDEVIGKPRDRANGIEMLMRLSGTTHRVLTGVTVASAAESRTKVVASDVSFRAVSDDEAYAYWHTKEPADKAGGYGLQGIGSIFVEKIHGSPSAVIGLPMLETELMLKHFGIDTWSGRVDRTT